MSKSIKQYLKDIEDTEPLDKEREHKLIEKAQNGNQWAFNKVIISNLRFVVKVAKSYSGQGLPLEDLISEGNYGLVKALKRFDLDRDVKLISYGIWWIKQSILSALYTHTKTVRLPLNKIINVNKIIKVREHLAQKLARDPTREEMEQELEDPSILDDLKHLHYMISLDKPRTDNDENLHNVIAQPENDLQRVLQDFRTELKDLIKSFPDREQKILLMYYGIDRVRPYTLDEIGSELDLTRERIRQIKEHVLEKLREKHGSEKLRGYDGIY